MRPAALLLVLLLGFGLGACGRSNLEQPAAFGSVSLKVPSDWKIEQAAQSGGCGELPANTVVVGDRSGGFSCVPINQGSSIGPGIEMGTLVEPQAQKHPTKIDAHDAWTADFDQSPGVHVRAVGLVQERVEVVFVNMDDGLKDRIVKTISVSG